MKIASYICGSVLVVCFIATPLISQYLYREGPAWCRPVAMTFPNGMPYFNEPFGLIFSTVAAAIAFAIGAAAFFIGPNIK